MRRLLLLALCGALALLTGYVAVPTIAAGHLIIAWGYYYMLAVFSLFVWFAWKFAQARREVWMGWLRRPGRAGLAIAAGLLFAVWGDTFRHKILFDEFVIQGTAYEMHVTKQVSTILRAYNIGGTWLSIDTYLDKRPFFLHFLVSLLHDLTGYRIANFFAINVAFAGAVIGILYWFARQLAGRGRAIFAVLLLSTLPIFCQNTSGAAMDMSIVAMICARRVPRHHLYLRDPGDDRLSLLVLGCVLLVESRYESILFFGPTAFVVALGWAPGAPDHPALAGDHGAPAPRAVRVAQPGAGRDAALLAAAGGPDLGVRGLQHRGQPRGRASRSSSTPAPSCPTPGSSPGSASPGWPGSPTAPGPGCAGGGPGSRPPPPWGWPSGWGSPCTLSSFSFYWWAKFNDSLALALRPSDVPRLQASLAAVMIQGLRERRGSSP